MVQMMGPAQLVGLSTAITIVLENISRVAGLKVSIFRSLASDKVAVTGNSVSLDAHKDGLNCSLFVKTALAEQLFYFDLSRLLIAFHNPAFHFFLASILKNLEWPE